MWRMKPSEAPQDTKEDGGKKATDAPGKLSLSTEGLRNVFSIDNDKFTFVVGDDEYHCSRVLAGLLSPKAAAMMLCDAMVDRFVIDIEDPTQVFGKMLKLTAGDSIEVDQENVTKMTAIAQELGNRELLRGLIGYECHAIELTPATAIERMKRKGKLEVEITEEASFIAENFYLMNTDDLMTLTVSELATVLEQPNLRLDSEDLLLELIEKLCQEDKSYEYLYRYIEMQFLSRASGCKFFDTIFPDLLDSVIWEKIRDCVYRQKGWTAGGRFAKVVRYDPEKPFNGIVTRLGRSKSQQRYSISSSGTASGTTTSVTSNGYTEWISNDAENSWICFELLDITLNLEKYELRSRVNRMNPAPRQANDANTGASSAAPPVGGTTSNGGWGRGTSFGTVWGTNPQSNGTSSNAPGTAGTSSASSNDDGYLCKWVIEASNDNSTWTILDERTEEMKPGVVKVFECANRPFKTFKFIRLRQTGPNSAGRHSLAVSFLDFYGSWTAQPGANLWQFGSVL